MSLAAYRGYEYQIENVSLSLCYVATLAGFGWYRLMGLKQGDAAFDFWFPFGEQSAYFTACAALNSVVQDACVHLVLRRADERQEKPCHYTRLFPGWLTDPTHTSHAWRMAATIQWVPAMLTQFAFALREIGAL